MPPAPASSARRALELRQGDVLQAQIARGVDAAGRRRGRHVVTLFRRAGGLAGVSPSACQLAMKRSCELAVAHHPPRARPPDLVRDRVDHRLVFLDRRGPAARRLEVAAELREQRVVALVEGPLTTRSSTEFSLASAMRVEEPIAPASASARQRTPAPSARRLAQAGWICALHLAPPRRRARLR